MTKDFESPQNKKQPPLEQRVNPKTRLIDSDAVEFREVLFSKDDFYVSQDHRGKSYTVSKVYNRNNGNFDWFFPNGDSLNSYERDYASSYGTRIPNRRKN